MSKKRKEVVASVKDAAAQIKDGQTVAIGGFGADNHPMALVREIIRKGTKNLTIIASATAGLEIDLLIGAQIVIGSSLGAQFRPEFLTRLFGLLRAACLVLLFSGGVMAVLAATAAWLIGYSIPTMILAMAPAGLAEMVLTGKLLGLDATIITGFLGAGKTTLLRHVLENAKGKRLAIIVNEFGSVGVDGETLRSCGLTNCPEENIVELSNGCLCCTVAEDCIPTMLALIDRPQPPEHILIETSGLALPKPLVKAFDWPDIRSRLTVDGVIAVVDAPAVVEGRFADDPEAIARQRAEDPSVDHDNPLAEVYEDQLMAADLIVLNKTDLISSDAGERLKREVLAIVPRAVKVVSAQEGRVDAEVLLGLGAAAEDDLAARPSHHDLDGEHDHDDFESFILDIPALDRPEDIMERLVSAASAHDILRMKGFADIKGKPMRLLIQGVGARFQQQFDRAWRAGERRQGRLVVIGQKGLDRAAIARSIAGE